MTLTMVTMVVKMLFIIGHAFSPQMPYSLPKSSFSIVLKMVIFTFFINVPNSRYKSSQNRAEMSNFAKEFCNYNIV